MRVEATARKYVLWCVQQAAAPWPPNHLTVAGYVCAHVSQNAGSTRSIHNLLSQLRVYCRKTGIPWLPESDAYSLRRIVAALEFEDRTPSRAKKPATLEVLLTVCGRLRPDNDGDILFALTMFVAHDGLLRAAELHSGLRVRDLRWDRRRREVVLPLYRTKTLRRGSPEMVTLRRYHGLCAYERLRHWFDLHELWSAPDHYIFPRLVRSHGLSHPDFSMPLSRSQWARDLKHFFRLAGYDPHEYSGHSLRAGGATDLFTCGTPYPVIKKAGRWKSEAALQYFREEDHVASAVAYSFGKQLQSVYRHAGQGAGERLAIAKHRSHHRPSPIEARRGGGFSHRTRETTQAAPLPRTQQKHGMGTLVPNTIT